MGFMVTFIDVNDETCEAYGRSWVIEDPQVETLLRHLAREHFGPSLVESTSEEAFEETRRLTQRGETWHEAREQIMKEKEQ